MVDQGRTAAGIGGGGVVRGVRRIPVGQGADGDHPGRVARAGDGAVPFGAVVPGGHHHYHSGVPEGFHRLNQRIDRSGFIHPVAKRKVGHTDAVNFLVRQDPVDPGDHVGDGTGSVVVQDFHRSDRRSRRNADDGRGGVAASGDDAGHVGSVSVMVVGIVPAGHVHMGDHFTGIVLVQVVMVGIPRVQDRYGHTAADPGVLLPHRHYGADDSPGDVQVSCDLGVRGDELHCRIVGQGIQGPGGQAQAHGGDRLKFLFDRCAAPPDQGALRLSRSFGESDDDVDLVHAGRACIPDRFRADLAVPRFGGGDRLDRRKHREEEDGRPGGSSEQLLEEIVLCHDGLLRVQFDGAVFSLHGLCHGWTERG